MKEIGKADRLEVGHNLNNRAENSHLLFRRRERAMSRFGRISNLQMFASTHASSYDHFNLDRHLNSRTRFSRTATSHSWNGASSWRDRRGSRS